MSGLLLLLLLLVVVIIVGLLLLLVFSFLCCNTFAVSTQLFALSAHLDKPLLVSCCC